MSSYRTTFGRLLVAAVTLAAGPTAPIHGCEGEGDPGDEWEISNPEAPNSGSPIKTYLPHADIACEGIGLSGETYSLEVYGDVTGTGGSAPIVQSASGQVDATNDNTEWAKTLPAPGAPDGWADKGNSELTIWLVACGLRCYDVRVNVADD